jgi:hypothetical protein
MGAKGPTELAAVRLFQATIVVRSIEGSLWPSKSGRNVNVFAYSALAVFYVLTG